MNRGLITGLALVMGVAPLSAQKVSFGVGGGLLAPLSDYKDSDNLGWQAGANVSFPVGPVAIRVDGYLGETSHKDVSGVKVTGASKPTGANADIVYTFKVEGDVKPYVLGGLGVCNLKVNAQPQGFPQLAIDTSVTKFSYNGGAGIDFRLGSVGLFVEARYVSVSTEGSATQFVPVTLGLKFGGE